MPFVESLFDGSIGSEAIYSLARVNVLFIDDLNSVVVYYREVRWVEKLLSSLQSETEALKRVV